MESPDQNRDLIDDSEDEINVIQFENSKDDIDEVTQAIRFDEDDKNQHNEDNYDTPIHFNKVKNIR